MTRNEYEEIKPMTNEEIDHFKNYTEKETDNSSIEELQERLNKEEKRIISLMKRIVIDVAKYNDYQPLEEFVNALINSKYLKNTEYKNYILKEGEQHLKNMDYVDFFEQVEELFEV